MPEERQDPTMPSKKPMFEEVLRQVINSYSMENRSDTPDYILAQYLSNCLANYESCVKSRDKWFGVDMWSENKLAKESNLTAYEQHQLNSKGNILPGSDAEPDESFSDR